MPPHFKGLTVTTVVTLCTLFSKYGDDKIQIAVNTAFLDR